MWHRGRDCSRGWVLCVGRQQCRLAEWRTGGRESAGSTGHRPAVMREIHCVCGWVGAGGGGGGGGVRDRQWDTGVCVWEMVLAPRCGTLSKAMPYAVHMGLSATVEAAQGVLLPGAQALALALAPPMPAVQQWGWGAVSEPQGADVSGRAVGRRQSAWAAAGSHSRQPGGLGLVSVAVPTMWSARAGEMAAALPMPPQPCPMLAWVAARYHSWAV
jgi:hypothetical protein